jgi:hypothetical protein
MVTPVCYVFNELVEDKIIQKLICAVAAPQQEAQS